MVTSNTKMICSLHPSKNSPKLDAHVSTQKSKESLLSVKSFVYSTTSVSIVSAIIALFVKLVFLNAAALLDHSVKLIVCFYIYESLFG